MKNFTKIVLGLSVVAVCNLSANSGESLYNKCKGCHGANGEKKALGKSLVIQGWTSQKVQDALNGYKESTYGGAMKGIMKGQVMAMSDEDIVNISDYIASK